MVRPTICMTFSLIDEPPHSTGAKAMVANTNTPNDPTLPRLCSHCHQPIHPARLRSPPRHHDVRLSCARLHPPAPLDANKLDLSQASPTAQQKRLRPQRLNIM